ncbi:MULTISPECIES: TetR family transcriptional regulator [Sphingomonas]|uniref:TetR family transcriptional regulator n=1 Tax=Sphingomonas olei TaxID=1886787 RepID=A0ABY2QKP2_9SPHN|nr:MULTISPECIES: TetR family transcriptional regulator [Sphingomonas]MDF2602875.1 transcriptional regulator, TetR family [Sphingomonas sp.]THG40178.1 TetR family transcriptional regulator [Sphingomonas olei]
MAKAVESSSPGAHNGRSEGPAREVLLQAASDLMIELGTPEVSLHAIARRAGVTAPLVKYYFGSKEGLLVALVERDTSRSLAQLDGLNAMAIDPLAKLKIHIAGIVRTYSRYPYLVGLLNHLLRESRTEGSDQIKANFVIPLIDAQRRIIEEGVAAGQFRPIDPDKLYFIIVGACQYLFSSRVAFAEIMDGKLSDEAFAHDFPSAVLDVILNGLRA